MNKKIAILGGAFNPIHIGHIEIANSLLNKYNFDEIWFLVSFNPPHKKLIDENNFVHRCNMVEIAIKNNNKFKLIKIEYDLYKNKIYNINSTYNVMNYIKNNYKNDFYIIIGYDELINIKSWVDYDKLLNENKFIIIKRINYNIDKNFIDSLKNDYNFKYDIIDVDITDCSSSNIRNEIKSGIKQNRSRELCERPNIINEIESGIKPNRSRELCERPNIRNEIKSGIKPESLNEDVYKYIIQNKLYK